MKKLTLLFVLLLVVAFFDSVYSQKYALLKPLNNNEVSDTIPVSKKDLKALDKLSKIILSDNSMTFGKVDTLFQDIRGSNLGWSAGDSGAFYFDPGARCLIKSVAFYNQTWNDQFADGYKIFIKKTNWTVDNTPADSIDNHGWAGVWEGGNWAGSSWGFPPFGALMWGDYLVTATQDAWNWVNMIDLGFEPDTEGEPFMVGFTPVGEAGVNIGFRAGDAAGNHHMRSWKWYQGENNSPGGVPGWYVRHYGISAYLVVEFIENTPPFITPESYGSVLSADAKTLSCTVTDIDENDEAQAGAAFVTLYYNIDGGVELTVACNLTSGTDKDGVWEGIVPEGYMTPGQTLTYYFVATDKAGLSTTSAVNSFGYFEKTTDILVVYNDNGGSYPSWILSQFYDNLWIDKEGNPFMYDVWVGLTDGPLTNTLVEMYNTIVHIDAFSPVHLNDDIYAAWFAGGSKNLFWSSQEWGYALTGGGTLDFAADDWRNKYLGIGAIGDFDINYAATGDQTAPWPINPVAGDVISGGLAEFLGDSLQLYYWADNELGFDDLADAFTPGEDAKTCFTDSLLGRAMGVHKEADGSKGVFLAFDQLCLDTWALPTYNVTDGYHWTEPNVSSVVASALNWFEMETTVKNIPTADIAAKYDLSQNYPNPFNPETQISYNIAKAGFVKLAVYNVLGQKVADLVDEHKVANTYKVTFDARDITSGIYFYRLEAGDYSKIMKMMLLQQKGQDQGRDQDRD